jgi:class 3 adenylate cyclase
MARNAVPSALEQVLRAEAWSNERLLNGFRAAIWGGVGAVAGGAELLVHGSVSPGALIALAWGLAAAVSGLTWLRRVYRPWIALLLASADLAVLALCMHAGHRYLLAHDGALVPHQLYGSGVVLMALLATNVLRFSWLLSLWSIAFGAAAYWLVLWLNGALDVLTYVELTVMGLLGLMLAYSARKLGAVLRLALERDALLRFLPAPVRERIGRDPSALELGGEQQMITALFADIRGFSRLAERLKPQAVVRLLNEFFAEMAQEVGAHGGVPMQYIGDNLYAVFPEAGGTDHACRALECAIAMLRRLERLNARRAARGEAPLAIGVGLHTGPVVAGSIGSTQLLQYSYVGDTVNTASRIERLTRPLGQTLLASAETFERAGGSPRFAAEALPPAALRGKTQPLVLWAVRGVRAAAAPRAALSWRATAQAR